MRRKKTGAGSSEITKKGNQNPILAPSIPSPFKTLFDIRNETEEPIESTELNMKKGSPIEEDSDTIKLADSTEQSPNPEIPDPQPSERKEDNEPKENESSSDEYQDTDERNKEDYPNTHYDPNPVRITATAKEKQSHSKAIHKLGDDMLETYKELELEGEELWEEFISVFRPHTITDWNVIMLTRWINFLSKNGIYIEKGRRKDKAQKLIDLLYRKHHIGPSGKKPITFSPPEPVSEPPSKLTPNLATLPRSVLQHTPEQKGPYIHPDRAQNRFFTPQQDRTTNLLNTPEPYNNQNHNFDHQARRLDPPAAGVKTSPTENHHLYHPEDDDHYPPDLKPTKSEPRRFPRSRKPPDDDDEDSSGSDERKGGWRSKGGLRPKIPGKDDADAMDPWEDKKRLGINGLMRALIGKPSFSGSWEEDLDNCICVFDTLSTMCEMTETEKLKSVPIMLSGDALNYYASNSKNCKTYEEATQTLRSWYNSDDRKARILTKWQSMLLTEAMAEEPDESEVTIFRKFVAKLTSLQNQLDPTYQTDQFLRDRLLTAVDIPSIQSTLRDRLPRTSQQTINRVANQLSDKKKTAGSNSVCMTSAYTNVPYKTHDPYENHVHYSLGKTYGGDARNATKKPWSNRPSRPNNSDGRRINSGWMRGVKGCFVCGGNHRANTRHKREEVTAAITKLKSNHPSALLTVDDLALVIDMVLDDDDEIQGHQDDDGVEWMDDQEATEEPSDIAFMTETEAKSVEQALSNSAYLHGQSYPKDMDTALLSMNKQLVSRSGPPFNGITIDTAANRKSVMCKAQYEAYGRDFGRTIPMRKPSRGLKGLGGKSKVLGEAMIQIPFCALHLIIDVVFAIVEEDIPSLLSNKDMLDNGLDISLQGKYLYIGSRRQPLVLDNYFFIYRWSTRNVPYALYTENELRRIHRGFGHPSVRATRNLLARSNNGNLNPVLMNQVKKIKADCVTCRTNASAPRRFKLTLGSEEIQFNHRVVVDTMFIQSRPVLHLVDEGTHFTSAAFLKNQSTAEIWKTICRLWIHTYNGPPDFLAVDQGSAYISKEMKSKAAAAGITMEEAPIETPGSIGIVERYHAPLRMAFTKLREDLRKDEATDDECLQLAVYACNATMGPEGLCPMLLVFGALPRPARISPSPGQLERQLCIEAAKKAVLTEQARRRITFALKHPSSPKAKEHSKLLMDLPAGSPILVYRTTSKKWEGPFKFISIEGETAVIQLHRGRKIFRSTCIKPYAPPMPQHSARPCHKPNEICPDVEEPDKEDEDIDDAHFTTHKRTAQSPSTTEDLDLGTTPRKIKVKKGSPEERAFATSRTAELNGLLGDGTFKPIHISKLKGNPRIFGCRFVDELKKVGSELKKKSRLVAQNYSDHDATEIGTKAPTIQRFSQRVALSIAASSPLMLPYTRDITQAYIQSHTDLEREVYIKAPPELNLPPDFVLQVVKPLYGIPESGLHWYLTYLSHHLDTLHMKRTRADPCMMIRRTDSNLDGFILLQVDDSLGFGSTQFLDEEQTASARFRCKPRTAIATKPITFNGINISRTTFDQTKHKYSINQTDKINKLSIVNDQKDFTSHRALAQYIGVNARPDVCAPVQLVAPGSTPTTDEEYKLFKRTVKHLKATSTQGLHYVPLDLTTTRLVLLTDSSFANAQGLKSQLGYIIAMVDEKDNCNIVHYGSNRCNRVARSVLAAEIQALVLGFDSAFLVKDLVEELLGRTIKLEALIDSKTVFNVIAKDGKTSEKRLQIDVLALRQSYDLGELDRIAWIPGKRNPADSLTKPVLTTSSPLYQVMKTNKLDIQPQGWAVSSSRERKSVECRTD